MRNSTQTLLCLWLTACSAAPQTPGEPANYGFMEDGDNVWVRGPWPAIKPSHNPDEVIDQLCPAIMELPRAQLRDYGQEYCGVIYSLVDGVYYASHASPLGPPVPVGPQKRKHCTVPILVKDDRGIISRLADFHSHPWAPSPLTQDDKRKNLQVYSIRIQFDTACHIMKLIPYVNENRPGEVYLRQGRTWKLVGYIKLENKETGIMTPVD